MFVLKTENQTSVSVCCPCNSVDNGAGQQEGLSIDHSSSPWDVLSKSTWECRTSMLPNSQWDAKLGVSPEETKANLISVCRPCNGCVNGVRQQGLPIYHSRWVVLSNKSIKELRTSISPNYQFAAKSDISPGDTKASISPRWFHCNDGDNRVVRQGLSIDHSPWVVLSKSIWKFRTSTSPNSQ